MASHPLKRNNTPRTSNAHTTPTPPSISAYDSTAHSDGGTYDQIVGVGGEDEYSNEYSEDISASYGDYDDLNSEAEEYYNSGASELVTTVR